MTTTDTQTTSVQFNLRFPKPFYKALKHQCVEEETTMRDWLENAARNFLKKRRKWTPEKEWPKTVLSDRWGYFGYPHYQCVPSISTHVITLNFTNAQLADHVKSQAEIDGITIRELMWTAAVDQVWTLRNEALDLPESYGIPEPN